MEKETTSGFRFIALFTLATLWSTMGIAFADSFDTETNLLSTVSGLNDTLYYQLEDCSGTQAHCLDIPIADIQNYQIKDNGVSYAAGIQGCDYDTFHLYQYLALPGNGGLGPYVLQSWGIGGSIFSTSFGNMQELVDSMNSWDAAANWQLDPANFSIIGGHPNTVYSAMKVWHPSLTNPVFLNREDHPVAQGTSINLDYGSHQISVRNISLGIVDTFQIYVSCTEWSTIALNINFGESDTFCLDFGELLLPLQMVSNDCPNASGTQVAFQQISGDSCITYSGLSPGIDTACMIACDEAGVCDTTLLVVTTVVNYQVGAHHVYDTLWEGQTLMHCIDLSVFGGMSAAVIRDICPWTWGSFTTIDLDATNYCVTYTGIDSPGAEDICIEVCDVAGVCDTTFFHLKVKNPDALIVTDTILLYDASVFCELQTDNLETLPMSMFNACISSSNEKVLFELDTINYCVTYGGLEPGLGSACIYVSDSLGNVDTTYFKIFVKLPSATTETIVLTEGDSMTYCIDTLELVGRLEQVVNDCSGEGNVEFFLDETLLCLNITALSPGSDLACYIFCDENGLCDTINWQVEVLAKQLPGPSAVEDYATVIEGQSLSIDLCANDDIPGGIRSGLELLTVAPLFGTVSLDATNCSLEYLSTGGGCSKTEELRYVVCNNTACDTASIYLKITCEIQPLTFYSGFSPNGDNRNDAFKIAGIEAFPNNSLSIFNRWGLRIFEVKGYQNDWKGTWKNQDLPEGVYFYLFDDGEGKQHSGYLVIQR